MSGSAEPFPRDVAAPVLVTGGSRTGSTWVGSTLAMAPRTRYLYEPFNRDIQHRQRWIRLPWQFAYLSASSPADLRAMVERELLYRRLSDRLAAHFGRRRRLVVKDPTAVFSTEWLAERFSLKVIITVRHPAAVASSRMRLGWRFDFNNLLSQQDLMEEHLWPFEAELRTAAGADLSILEESVLLWKCIYHVVESLARRHPEWKIVRHEDLCANPVVAFGELFEHAGLDMTPAVRRSIEAATGKDNPGETQAVQHSLRRDSGAVSELWKRRLNRKEIIRIRDAVGELGELFYPAGSWQAAGDPDREEDRWDHAGPMTGLRAKVVPGSTRLTALTTDHR